MAKGGSTHGEVGGEKALPRCRHVQPCRVTFCATRTRAKRPPYALRNVHVVAAVVKCHHCRQFTPIIRNMMPSAPPRRPRYASLSVCHGCRYRLPTCRYVDICVCVCRCACVCVLNQGEGRREQAVTSLETGRAGRWRKYEGRTMEESGSMRAARTCKPVQVVAKSCSSRKVNRKLCGVGR